MNSAFKDSIHLITEHLKGEFALIRTGRATLQLVDSVRVESYGSLMLLNQIGTLSIEDARTIRISPWDNSVVGAIEKGIIKADLGVTTSVSDGGVRIHFPELTGETRERLVKIAKEKHEEARVSLKGERNKAISAIESQKKGNEIGEDEASSAKEVIEKITVDTNKEFDALFAAKKEEILTI